MNCPHCDEPILPGEVTIPCLCCGGTLGDATPHSKEERLFHRECMARMVVGSVGHQRQECHCHGKTDFSEVGKTKREAAKDAWAWAVAMRPECMPEQTDGPQWMEEP